jgi:hypothetical protein
MQTKKQYLLKELKEWAEVIWQFPQNLVGIIVVAVTQAEPTGREFEYVARKWPYFGVSLGDYIIFGQEKGDTVSYMHEYGHHKQSLHLGWFYLIVVGVPSLIGNLWDRFAHKNWSHWKREKWYYTRFPENWADRLGCVDRGFND